MLVSPSKIKVSDVGSDVVEDLDFSGGRVVEMSLGFGHLVAATQNQVHEANHQQAFFAREIWRRRAHLVDTRVFVSNSQAKLGSKDISSVNCP